jgi:hypothetical protein
MEVADGLKVAATGVDCGVRGGVRRHRVGRGVYWPGGRCARVGGHWSGGRAVHRRRYGASVPGRDAAAYRAVSTGRRRVRAGRREGLRIWFGRRRGSEPGRRRTRRAHAAGASAARDVRDFARRVRPAAGRGRGQGCGRHGEYAHPLRSEGRARYGRFRGLSDIPMASEASRSRRLRPRIGKGTRFPHILRTPEQIRPDSLRPALLGIAV